MTHISEIPVGILVKQAHAGVKLINDQYPEAAAILREAITRFDVLREVHQLAKQEAQPVIAEQWRSFVTDADIAALHRFVECCDDPESGGHDLEKEQVQRLEQIGALQRSGRISYITDFGDYLIFVAPAQEGE